MSQYCKVALISEQCDLINSVQYVVNGIVTGNISNDESSIENNLLKEYSGKLCVDCDSLRIMVSKTQALYYVETRRDSLFGCIQQLQEDSHDSCIIFYASDESFDGFCLSRFVGGKCVESINFNYNADKDFIWVTEEGVRLKNISIAVGIPLDFIEFLECKFE